MKAKSIVLLAMAVAGSCSEGQRKNNDVSAMAHPATEGRVVTAVVTGFGGPGSRRGFINVYLRRGELIGVIPGVLPEELDCKIGDQVPVRISGNAIVPLRNACRKTINFTATR